MPNMGLLTFLTRTAAVGLGLRPEKTAAKYTQSRKRGSPRTVGQHPRTSRAHRAPTLLVLGLDGVRVMIRSWANEHKVQV